MPMHPDEHAAHIAVLLAHDEPVQILYTTGNGNFTVDGTATTSQSRSSTPLATATSPLMEPARRRRPALAGG
eukprot:SAG22_NODE_1878_length_3382_cov_6.372830_3_plen_72_part_00